ncbi:Hcp family type VI secretion system effector [Burkholderia ubonensis]|uniref:Hcp1 family type VI secretion system effector n=1 Tax=Burkholderia ubonensis TaxID=101571 RepID=A0AB74DDC5_9BURK|nr:type VI secretion system tube protein Hcp [Burkholderia ubonensis]PAJ77386.1 Hcp1 family type VI secretion system effector [Burkholderia ubonensis]PAJ83690.1 Hcp1 family type VI secretion system effector [Burkholderia ubonensis]PAJ90837.1 Hcp1 family type VI secretion system effector [Burkholderia ubonensis]PAJ96890.1 Hcp1 family type VI secretion system effector [Burkholderia ubonensis]PAK04076.1 Hcp1 family type VI secretion system effector [Burkholderia ubonensis]
MAQDIFLKLKSIDGESQDPLHSNGFNVLTRDWSVSQQSNMHSGASGGAGKCKVDNLVFEHYVDRAPPNLMLHCLTSKHIDRAILVMRKAGGTPLEHLKITMHNVLITRIRPTANYNTAMPREEVQLSFACVMQEYVIQNSQGGSGGTASMGYDIPANEAI